MKWWDVSWNPVVGCTPASSGCDNCYAKSLHDMRHEALLAGKGMPSCYSQPFERVRCLPERLKHPFGWRKPKRIFVNSMSDLFHPDVPDEFIARVWEIMRFAQRHTFIVLTKRSARMSQLLKNPDFPWVMLDEDGQNPGGLPDPNGFEGPPWPLPNVWLGVTMESPAYYWRYEDLLITPAAKRIVSFEPLLAEMDIGRPHPDWVICGGETGPGARPMHPDWARSLRDQCKASEVPFFFKQWGAWVPMRPSMDGTVSFDGPSLQCEHCPKRRPKIWGGWEIPNVGEFPKWMYAIRLTERGAGRLLDGVDHNEIPGANNA